MSKKPEEERESGAEEETGDDWEVEGGVFTAVDNVAGEFSQAKREFATEVKKRAYEDQEAAENEEGTAEFAEGVHEKDSRRNEVKK